ncbi:MAG TPA: diguanylate cyclase, partial [Hyphomicrobiales bacterium]|nr:diguanylate cyclase [Hyphomicrobiales bacterium]
FAERLRASVRGIDLACRYGGEEFVIVMPEADLGIASTVAERLRRRVASPAFQLGDGRELDITISIGVAGRHHGEHDGDALLKRADQALYRAKRDGRNRVVADAA